MLSNELKRMCCVTKGPDHGPSPIPEEGKWVQAREIKDISGFAHGCGTCAPQMGTSKLTLNVKGGIIEEALIENIGCSGMTQSAAMAAEILPGKTILEALNTDLVCDAINSAMKQLFLQIVYGRTQSSYSDGGLPIGGAWEDLGAEVCSQVGTSYGSLARGPRYLEITGGYVTRMALDDNQEIIGYEYVQIGRMMDLVAKGLNADEALEKAKKTYGRFAEAAKYIDPRRD
jgi:NifU-like protein involved in Fe-S cluster formation